MNIRQKLTFQFVLIVSLILMMGSLVVYFMSADYRHDNFYERLKTKAENTAKLLIDVDEIDINLLRKIESDNPTSLPRERITIYNNDEEVLFSTDHDDRLMVSSALLDSVKKVQEVQFKIDSFEAVGFVFGAKKNLVVAGAVDLFGQKRLENLRSTMIYVTIISLLFLAITGWFYAGRALKPIDAMVSRVNEISINRLSLRIDEGKGNDELSRLARTFNRMLQGLEEAFTVQKNFIANASHELRTPLTAITGQLEVELMKDRTSEEYKETIESVLEDMKNLNAISNRLLLLTQTSPGGAQVSMQNVRVDEVLWQVKAELKKRNPGYSIAIHFHEQLTDDHMLTVHGNEELLKTAFINLVDNACKFSPDHSAVVALKPQRNHLVIDVIDKGGSIDKADLPHLFDPFYRGKNAAHIKGHGIGLSLVLRIVNMHRGHITAQSSSPGGTRFTVSLPTS